MNNNSISQTSMANETQLQWIVLIVLVGAIVYLLFFSEPSMTVIKEAGEYKLHKGKYRIEAKSGTVALTIPTAKGCSGNIEIYRAETGALLEFAMTGDDTLNGVASTAPPDITAVTAAGQFLRFSNDGVAGWYDA